MRYHRYFTIFLIVGGKRGGLEREIQFPRPHLVFHFYSVPFHGTFQKCDCVRWRILSTLARVKHLGYVLFLFPLRCLPFLTVVGILRSTREMSREWCRWERECTRKKNKKDMCIRNEKERKETKGLKNDNCPKQLKKKKNNNNNNKITIRIAIRTGYPCQTKTYTCNVVK